MNAAPLGRRTHQVSTRRRTHQLDLQVAPSYAKSRPKTPSHSEWAVTEVLHSIKGRVRLKVPALKRYPALAQALEIGLRACPGILGVWANRNCASLTVSFDPRFWSAGKLCAYLGRLSSETLRALSRAVALADDRASQEAGGTGFELVLSTAGMA